MSETTESAKPSLLRQLQSGLFRPWPSGTQARAVMSHYQQTGLATRLEQELRLRICPFESVTPFVPLDGTILDLGCGFGVLAHLLAMESSKRQVTGIEQMASRVAVAQRAAVTLPNLRFVSADIHQADFGTADGMVMNDVLHHIPHDLQIPLLKKCYASLAPGGLLLIKDVTKSPASKYIWNYTHDFIRNGNLPFYCLDLSILRALLELVGFQVKVSRLDTGYPYPHVLYVCAKQ